MLVEISRSKAFELLMNKETRNDVYFKNVDGYQKAGDYKWVFRGTGGVNFTETDFYREEEPVSPRRSIK